MTDSTSQKGRPSRSMGLKLLVVCALALVMIIPAFFVRGLVAERMHRAEAAAGEVGGLSGGPQTFLGPVLAVPWRAPAGADGDQPSTGVLIVFPKTGAAKVSTQTTRLKRSLYSVPVYDAQVSYSAKFDLSDAAAAAPTGAVLDWSRAEFLIGASDAKGARSAIKLVAGGHALELAPSELMPQMELEGPSKPADGQTDAQQQQQQPSQPQQAQGVLHLFGAPASGFAPNTRSGPFEVAGTMSFSGARRVGVLAFARDTTVSIEGDWASPSFGGSVSATDRDVSARGFKASWSVPYVARGVAEAGQPSLIGALGGTEMSTAFVEPANPYQSVERSLKYTLLFVGLVFLAYFIFETASDRRLHPAQYVLVGLAQTIFYLLLLSISEQLGFDAAFLIAAAATVSLISLNVSWVFGGLWRFLVAFVLFSGLYGLIYVLMRLEDYALLVGAVASFAAIALVMFFTRRIDWYGGFKLESEA